MKAGCLFVFSPKTATSAEQALEYPRVLPFAGMTVGHWGLFQKDDSTKIGRAGRSLACVSVACVSVACGAVTGLFKLAKPSDICVGSTCDITVRVWALPVTSLCACGLYL